jgi:hypothetical protein
MVGIGNQTSEQIDQKVETTAMARMLNLTNIFELVIDRFDNGPFTQQNLVPSFMGSPAMNLFRTHLHQTTAGQFAIDFGATPLELSPQTLAHHPKLIQYVGQPLIAGLLKH